MLRLLIADDHDLVRAALVSYLADITGHSVAQAASLDEAVARIKAQGPYDLVLLDYTMPGMSLPAGLHRAIEANSPHPVAILSGTAPPEVARRALAAGAQGFVPKSAAPDTLIAAVQAMIAGQIFRPDAFLDSAGTDKPHVTPREVDVLRGLVDGKSNKEIARDLDIQEVTIKLHVKTICRKLQAKNRTHAAMLARDLDLLS